MNRRVHNPRNSINTPNNCKYTNKKLDRALIFAVYILSYRRKLELELKNAGPMRRGVIRRRLIIRHQLIDMLSRHSALKVAWHRHELENGPNALRNGVFALLCDVVRGAGDAVGRVLQVQVRVVTFNVVVVLLLAEGNVVDFVGVVHVETLVSERKDYVVEGVGGDMEVARDPVDFDVAGETAALLSF